MGRKIALLIGVGDYGTGLKSLQCPVNGVSAMQTVLKNPEIGGFDEVISVINPDVGEMRSRISTTFAQLKKDDLILFYFTGHGVKDMTGNFYLTTTQSELFDNNELNTGTAVESEFIKRVISRAYAERKVVILDCCFAAAFADGVVGMDDSSIDVETQLGAKVLGDKGYCVLTASTSMRYALEQANEELSVYTRYLVEGLKTGGAAPEDQEFISLRHWHEYVKAQVKVAAPAMEPAMFNAQQGYDIVIAKVLVDAEQSYRKQVQKKVKAGRGWLRPSAKANLVQWQRKYGISAEQAAAIQTEVLKPYLEKAKHVNHYAEVLAEEKDYAFPLDGEAVTELQELKRLLNLLDEDVVEAEIQILGGSLLSQAERELQKVQSSFSSQQAPVSASLPVESNEYPMFGFETVRVNEQGKVIDTVAEESEYLTEDLGNGVTLDMVRVPGGKFLMGAAKGEEGASKDEYPQHEVQVPEFWMGKFAVTQAQWKAVSGLKQVEKTLRVDPAQFKGSQRPVESVSWDDAMEFCQRLSQHSGKLYSLPSEAQWEYACRAGTTTPFYFGPTITTDLANYCGTREGNGTYRKEPKGSYRSETTEVGISPPNTFGLYDMHGNVWEWCLDDWHDTYEGAPTDGSTWGASSNIKVLRGGSWANNPAHCRAADRLSSARDN
ncbi:MAG: SUMF1/EgtB/PvdO family nonheme iron enzyme, partial [Cyanobacteria bacterium P01_C01_bin.69]